MVLPVQHLGTLFVVLGERIGVSTYSVRYGAESSIGDCMEMLMPDFQCCLGNRKSSIVDMVVF